MIGRSRKATFSFIKDRIWKKLNSWSSKCLSQAGREVLIKSVLQSIPSYIMSIFLLPASVIDDIEKMLNSFWWGHNRSQAKGIHWMSWERLSVHKQAGGMGFKSLKAFNHAMLGKQAWNFLTKPDALVTKLFKAKYFPRSDFLEASIGHNPSYVWRSIWSSKFVVKGGHHWSIGTGHNISAWDHNWLSDGTIMNKPENLDPNIALLTVANLLDQNAKEWDSDLIHGLVDETTAEKILQTPLLESVQTDKITWKHEKNGVYTVKSAYRACIDNDSNREQHHVDGRWQLIWQSKVPPKINFFFFGGFVGTVCQHEFDYMIRV
jgi:hypothetical protein